MGITTEQIPNGNDRSTRPRLFIQEMILRNFKSYAGEQRVGPFHKSFSAVVGPNGSGKSNVIDAMLFVFGKRAKQMRLNKVSELIHNSTNHQNLDSASVSVHFQEIVDLENGGYNVLHGSDFVITRAAFRDNSSKYYINDCSSNFTEVTKKLKGKGVDLDNNRFLILQGEVEQISLMKSKAQGPHEEGFLEYLEDIIGTNQYVEKIEESYKLLDVLNEKRSGSVQIVKIAEKERDNLENVKDEAESYLLKELLLLKWQEKATELSLDDIANHLIELQQTLLGLEASLANERDAIRKNTKILKDLEADHNNHMKRQEELDKVLLSCKDKFKEFERHDVKYSEDLVHINQKVKKLEERIEKDIFKSEETKKDIEVSHSVIHRLEMAIPEIQQQLTCEEKILEELKEQARVATEGYHSELSKVRDELQPWEKEMIEHKGKLDVASAESRLLKEKHLASRAAFDEAERQMNDLNKKIEVKTAEIERIQSDISKNHKLASDARRDELDYINKQETLASLEQVARQKLTELSSVMESEKSRGSIFKEILQAKRSSQIEGIYGRIGDLGAIDGKYDVAISTACPGLDYILVESATAAASCVNLLRERNLGVATFLILEMQVHHFPRLLEKVETPEGVPRLFDLVHVQDDRLRLAFFEILQNTVVAKDVDQATRIAYSGNKAFRRVVTLDGVLFETSGTMTGGGSKPRGGKMGTSIRSSVSEEAVTLAEKELVVLIDELTVLRQKLSDAVRLYTGAEKTASRLEMDLAKCHTDKENLFAQYHYLDKQLASLKAASLPNKDELERIAHLERITLSEKEEAERITKFSKKLVDKACVLQSKIENAGGEQLKKQKTKVNSLLESIDKNESEINHHKVRITTNEKVVKKLIKEIEELKKEGEKMISAKDKMVQAFKEAEKKATIVKEEFNNTQELANKHKDVLDAAKIEYNNVKKIVEESRAAEIDAEYRLHDTKKTLKDWEMKSKECNKGLADLKLRHSKQMELIQKDGIDAGKLNAILNDGLLKDTCELKRASDMVVLIEAQLKEMNPNLDSIAEYRAKTSLYNERVEELNAITQERDELKKQYDDLRKRRLDEFMAGFNAISLKLKEMYQMITLGGDAELELVDSLDPFSEGVVFSVRPPKKSWKNIANLSGGEKTLSSLALVFALHHYKPTPLYVMDEIDAALDFKNVSIVGHYVKDRTKDAQFIIISLRNNMFELADWLVGIYKTDNCTKSITINPSTFVVATKASK